MTMTLSQELAWLQANPDFEERPASISEFLGPEYLNIEAGVRESIRRELVTIMGDKTNPERMAAYGKAIITGGIGIGKTTIASIVLPYMAHWVLCLKDPQKYFGLLAGSRIAFMQMSTSGSQAKEVVFGDIKARIQHSPWFSTKYPYNKDFKNQLRFDKEIWILPGDSAETTFEGYNILGGILDEADSHKVTKEKDYAEQGYTTISSRITSRFQDRGFVLIIGQMKRANGFAARMYEEFRKDPTAYAVRMSIWESMGWQKFLDPSGQRVSFWYDPKRHEIIPKTVGDLLKNENSSLIEIPCVYEQEFKNNPEKALRDLAGIPPQTNSPFISLTYKVDEARDRWIERQGDDESPYKLNGTWQPWFRATESLKRVGHIDIATSGDGDGLGFAMGHVHEMRVVEGELKPYIIIDCLVRITAPSGREIHLGDVRRMIYTLKDDFKFKIVKVTMDGFQSTDTKQQLERHRIGTEIVSIDKSMLPYYDLREALYEDRIEFPKYMVKLRDDDTTLVEILAKELVELVDTGMKVDHPPEGSKDVADAVAGVVYELMGDRSYHRNRMRDLAANGDSTSLQATGPVHHAVADKLHVPHAPLPPALPMEWRPPKRR